MAEQMPWALPSASTGQVTPPSASAGRYGRRALRAIVTAGWALLGTASRALAGTKQVWKRVPRTIRDAVHVAFDATGVPYALNYLAGYDATHQLGNFAGNLLALNAAYMQGSADEQERLAQQFKGILDALVMKNGVTRSTRPMRQNPMLMRLLSDPDCGLDTPTINVLELPSSSGVAALAKAATLGQRYKIREYVLGDLSFHLNYDADRECVFDDEFNLLQVKFKEHFFSVYRPARSGKRYTSVSTVLLLPLELMSRYLQTRYAYRERDTTVPLPLLHPDVQAKVRAGDMTVRRMDVFGDIAGRFDLILCFNLLLRNYFSPEQISKGVRNLTQALDEQGLLIMGDETSYSVARKVNGALVSVRQEGRF